MESYNGPPFDLIIEDLFVENKREPVRAVQADNGWFSELIGHITRSGIVVMNFISNDELNQSAYYTSATTRKRFNSAFQLSMPVLDNIVGVFMKEKVEGSLLRKNLAALPKFRQELQNKKLSYRMKALPR